MSAPKTIVTTPRDRETCITREFNAPVRLVWDAHTKPDLVKRWLFGPDGWALDICTIDLRVGGKARYEMRRNGGPEAMGWTDTYLEIAHQDRIVATEIFDEDWTGGETTVTLLFRAAGDKTSLEMTVLYTSQEARDGALQSGMTQGMEMGYARLDTLFTELAG